MIIVLFKDKVEYIIQTSIVVNYPTEIQYVDPVSQRTELILKSKYKSIKLCCDDGSLIKKIV